MSKKTKHNQQTPIDLVAEFYDQEKLDLDQIVRAKKASIQSVVNYSLAPYSGNFGFAQRKHLLNRTMVGLCKRHLDDLENVGLEDALDLILTPEFFDEPVNNYYHQLTAADYEELYNNEDVPAGDPFINRSYANNESGELEQFGHERYTAIVSWVNQRIYKQDTSIHWKLFIFLHNLVPTRCFDLGHKAAFLYIKLLFEACFGSYKEFIYKVTLDPSMLDFLNLALSQKDTPDENYAREVQELFTVGKRPFAQFTENDVREIARALVGWTYDYEKLVFSEGTDSHVVFEDNNHDIGDKAFSTFYNNQTIKGKSGMDGQQELQEVVDMLFNTEESGIYLCRRLYQFFVYPVLTPEIESQIIAPLAQVFKDNDHSLVAVLRVLLGSEHFYDAAIPNSIIKSPMDYNMGMLKELMITEGHRVYWDGEELHQEQFTPNHPAFLDVEIDQTTLSYNLFGQSLHWSSYNQGMQLFTPPNVSGWPAFYQEPVYDMFWINSSTIKSRKQAAHWFRWGLWLYSYEDQGVSLKYDLHSYLSTYRNPADFEDFFNEFNERLCGAPVGSSTYITLKKELLGNINEMHWEEYINDFLSDPTKEILSAVQWRFDNVLFKFFELSVYHIH
ncbi:MAG: DUF1800 family protein [Flavobacteriaceae bacterium]|nr:DUF1800 family protein [Flavobacteriaceae bacterium]